jgi:calpain-15
LAALAERPDRIFNLFLLREKNKANYYSVRMLYRGKWLRIDMDEYIPMIDNKPAFSKSVRNDLWVILLEKAWAKIYTSYQRIALGHV